MTLLESPGQTPGNSTAQGPMPIPARAFSPGAGYPVVSKGLYVRFGKRAANLALFVAVMPPAILIAAPIAVANAILLRSVRRVFFLQDRIGRNGEPFRIFKFRTMREAQPSEHFDSWSSGGDGVRVTAFGRLLRNTHLDELPQLLNVLRGDMDFVGPRPEMVEVHRWACAEVPEFAAREQVRPGITGLAQVTQGYVTKDTGDYARKLAIDLEYIDRVSLCADATIVARTFVWMLVGRGWRQTEDATQTAPVDSGTLEAATRNGNALRSVEGDRIEACPREPQTLVPSRAPVSFATRSSSSTTRARGTRNVRID